MDLAPFTPAIEKMIKKQSIDIMMHSGEQLSIPVAVRRDTAQYDAMFFYRYPDDDGISLRPDAWVLLNAQSGDISLFANCELIDFMPTGRYEADLELNLERTKPLNDKKIASMQDKLMSCYEQMRSFVFEENLTRQQAGIVADYKELFLKLHYPAHYNYYHGLSPAFFHWLRMPLPKEATDVATRPISELQRDSYQLLILENLQHLVTRFQDKIQTDQHKEQMFNNMHEELMDYKNGLMDSLTLSLERDIIHLIDSIEKTIGVYRDKDKTAENYERLFSQLVGVETDLCDLLYRHGIEPYTENEVDVIRQQIIRTVDTEDTSLDKTIAEHLTRGWAKQDRIIRPERVSVYVAQKTAAKSE